MNRLFSRYPGSPVPGSEWTGSPIVSVRNEFPPFFTFFFFAAVFFPPYGPAESGSSILFYTYKA